MKYFLIFIVIMFSFQSMGQEKKKKGFSTLPGWSGGYRYYLDLDEDEKSTLLGGLSVGSLLLFLLL